jgi:hypothetical protein
MTPERLWAEWLDSVESAARRVEQQALVQDVPQTPEVAASGLPAPGLPTPAFPASALPMPAAPWPASLEPRRREVLATLAAATRTVERRRNETAAALNRLAHAPSRRVASGYTDGVALDVLG